MVKRTTVHLIDDLDGTVLEPGEGHTIAFGINGTNYEIDLGDAHADELRDILNRYAAAGRRTSPARGRSRRPSRG